MSGAQTMLVWVVGIFTLTIVLVGVISALTEPLKTRRITAETRLVEAQTHHLTQERLHEMEDVVQRSHEDDS